MSADTAAIRDCLRELDAVARRSPIPLTSSPAAFAALDKLCQYAYAAGRKDEAETKEIA